MDFSGSEQEFTDQSFKRIQRDGARLEGKEFSGCTFTHCTLREADILGCSFRACKFKNCDLSLAKLDGSMFFDVTFENSRLLGLDWTKTSWANEKLLFVRPADFSGCALNHSIFMWLNMKEIKLTGCTAHNVDFSEANLTLADCTRTDFLNSRFWHTDLTEADFTRATNYSIPANLNTLKKTKFSLPEAMSLLYSLDIEIVEDDEIYQ